MRCGKARQGEARDEDGSDTHLQSFSAKSTIWSWTVTDRSCVRRLKRSRRTPGKMFHIPKWPEKRASRQFSISGIHLYKSSKEGMRRMIITAINNTMSREGLMPSSDASKASKGNQAPIYMKQPQFKTRSKTDEKDSFSVWVLKSPSQDSALPIEMKR